MISSYTAPIKTTGWLLIASAALLCPSTATAEPMFFRADLQTLNAAFGSTATGTVDLTLNDPSPTVRTLRVQISATGLQDLSSIPGAIHVAHIHGQFLNNASKPLADQGDGLFFDGLGGADQGVPPVDSILPSVLDDGAINVDETTLGFSDLYLDFFEGRPDYGPVVLNLTSTQLDPPSEGLPPLTNFFQLAIGGAINPANLFPSGSEFMLDALYTFDLTDANGLRQFNNLMPLDFREIVLHGLTIPTSISDAIDAATGATPGSPTAGIDLGNGLSFRATAPVAAGEIVRVQPAAAVPEPATISLLGIGIAAWTITGYRRRRRRAA